MLTYKDFFELNSDLSSTKFHAHLFGYNNKKNAEKRLLIGDYEGFEFPLTFKHERQHKALDILVTGPYLYLISDRMKKILEENKLTGWNPIYVKLFDIKNNEIPGYYGFSISGRCGPVDYHKCEIIERRYVENGPLVKEYIGLPIGLEEWDGSDFFLPKGWLGTIITPKAADIFKKNKITNLALTRLSDVVTPEFSLEILGLKPSCG